MFLAMEEGTFMGILNYCTVWRTLTVTWNKYFEHKTLKNSYKENTFKEVQSIYIWHKTTNVHMKSMHNKIPKQWL